MNSSRLIVLTLALCILTGVWGYCHDCSREPDDTGDESVYLSESAWIAEHGGICGYLRLCFQGRYQQTGAYPLLAVAASPFASRDLAFIRPARLFKSALTTLALIGLFLVTGGLNVMGSRRMAGRHDRAIAELARKGRRLHD